MFGIVANILIGLMKAVFGISKSGTTLTLESGNQSLTITASDTVGINALRATTVQVGASGNGGGVLEQSGSAAVIATQAGTWLQNTSGQAMLAADVTNATTTFANLTGLSVTLKSGRKYGFRMVLFVSDSVGADGVKIDFDGGTVTATNFRAHATLFDTALVLSTQATALATDFVAATVTGDGMFECYGTIEPSANGTLIPRAAQNAHTTGTLTTARGSHIIYWDLP